MKNILIAIENITPEQENRLKEAAGANQVRFIAEDQATGELADWADIIIGNISTAIMKGRKPEFMQLISSGADAYVRDGVLDPSATVLACCTGAYSQTVAEHSLAATLMLLKKLHLYRDLQRDSRWADAGNVGSIDGATIIVMGLGEIGRYYARMAKALGAYVIGVNRRGGDKPDCVDELYTTDCFDSIAGRADIIFSVMPGTPATKHFFTEERFHLMKPSAVFVNSGRGNAVSAEVLWKVLSEKVIDCAAVDVFEQEPLPAQSPLWKLDNLLITPHASGFYHMPVTRERVVAICEKNLKAWLADEPLTNVVDFSTGYRKHE